MVSLVLASKHKQKELKIVKSHCFWKFYMYAFRGLREFVAKVVCICTCFITANIFPLFYIRVIVPSVLLHKSSLVEIIFFKKSGGKISLKN